MNRDESLARLADGKVWDVLVIGGGASGLGTALEAASRGYTTALVEQADFAQSTSSRSTKLVHGGVRYLEQGNIKLVYEALHERGVLLRNAPELAHVLPLVLPLQSLWERLYMGIGLTLYDLLAGRQSLGHSRYFSEPALREKVPGFTGPAAGGGLLFYDGQFDDARLAMALARTLSAQGGAALNYAQVTGLLKDEGKIAGATVEDLETGTRHDVRARAVINATGVFTDELERMDDPAAPERVTPSQGIHFVLPKRYLPGDTAILIPKTADGRVLFAIPWLGRVLLGTTDTPVQKAELEPRALPEEIAFLFDHARRFLGWDIGPGDVLSVFAGLRPLVKNKPGEKTSKLARDHVITVSRSGLVNLSGGKWTTYRLMGEQTVTRAARSAGLPERKSVTAGLRLETGPMANEIPNTSEVKHLVAEEMARTVEDVLARRTRALLLDARAALTAAPAIAEAMAGALGRGKNWQEAQVQAFTNLASGYLLEP